MGLHVTKHGKKLSAVYQLHVMQGNLTLQNKESLKFYEIYYKAKKLHTRV